MQHFRWQWASVGEVSKLLGSPFGLTLSMQDVDSFLSAKIDRKLAYWSSLKLNAARKEVVANGILISSMLYFLAL
jgi:hypothetical protein